MRPGAIRTAAWVLVLLLAGAAAAETGRDSPPRQEVLIRVLDTRDRPVAGAQVTFTPLAGSPARPGPFRTDRQGELRLQWKPRVEDLGKEQGLSDRILRLVSRLDYQVQAPGFFPTQGRLERSGQQRTMSSPELRGLDRRDRLVPLVATVVLRRPRELLAGDLARRRLDDPLVKRLLEFHRRMRPVVLHLGVDFAWPAFSLRGKELALIMQWRGTPWAGLAQAPLKARVVASAGMPLVLACGQDLLPLPGVERLAVEVKSEVSPPGDPYALPAQAVVRISAPAGQVLALAQGRLSPDDFLMDNQPVLETGSFPPARPPDTDD